VPVIYSGINYAGAVDDAMAKLVKNGSFAAEGFMNPEGIVLFHVAAQTGFKKTVHKDEQPKSLAR
jgi:hypothetical protein